MNTKIHTMKGALGFGVVGRGKLLIRMSEDWPPAQWERLSLFCIVSVHQSRYFLNLANFLV